MWLRYFLCQCQYSFRLKSWKLSFVIHQEMLYSSFPTPTRSPCCFRVLRHSDSWVTYSLLLTGLIQGPHWISDIGFDKTGELLFKMGNIYDILRCYLVMAAEMFAQCSDGHLTGISVIFQLLRRRAETSFFWPSPWGSKYVFRAWCVPRCVSNVI